MKKLIALLGVLILTFFTSIAVSAETVLVDFKLSNGTQVYLDRAKTIKAKIPTEYQLKDRDFRAVWISQFAGDIPIYTTKEAYISKMMSVLDKLQEYNINAIMYHVRIMNDALFKSRLSPKSGYIGSVNFQEWDYLEWLIGEVHRRGMEFHAWMNPYRVQNSVGDVNEIANRYRDFPMNPASDPEMLLVGNSGVILNPGEPSVREFIIDTAMELIENYDVDAIHYDDYFYIAMNQSTDLHTYNKYKAYSRTTNIEQWRHEQVDLFIKGLSDEMRAYNLANNRQVQLGISPSGIYKNGNGVVTYDPVTGYAITNGSDTQGFNHYGYYLYSDSKKWIDLEWIDYVVPQVYWEFSRSVAMHGAIVNWWQQVVKNSDVNLYIGMGLYQFYESGSSWKNDPYEASNQVLFSSQFDNVNGMVIYKYASLLQAEAVAGVKRIKDSYWNSPSLNPEIKTMNAVVPNKVSDVNIVKSNSGFILDWQSTLNARKYAIYRNTGAVDINDPKQLVGIVGLDTTHNIMIFEDKVDNTKDYNYAVVAVSGTNTKGQPYNLNTSVLNDGVSYDIAIMEDIRFSGNLLPGQEIRFAWNEAVLIAGSALTYKFEYSSDQINWSEHTGGRHRKSGDIYSYTFDYPFTQARFYYRVVGKNELGTVVSNILSTVPEANNLTEYVEFIKILIDDKISDIFSNNK